MEPASTAEPAAPQQVEAAEGAGSPLENAANAAVLRAAMEGDADSLRTLLESGSYEVNARLFR